MHGCAFYAIFGRTHVGRNGRHRRRRQAVLEFDVNGTLEFERIFLLLSQSYFDLEFFLMPRTSKANPCARVLCNENSENAIAGRDTPFVLFI